MPHFDGSVEGRDSESHGGQWCAESWSVFRTSREQRDTSSKPGTAFGTLSSVTLSFLSLCWSFRPLFPIAEDPRNQNKEPQASTGNTELGLGVLEGLKEIL